MIGNGVTNIGRSAFECCYGLKNVTIPSSVTSIDDYAFDVCNSLKSVLFKGDAPAVGAVAFRDVAEGCVVKVRKDSVGWGVGEGEVWNGLILKYVNESAPGHHGGLNDGLVAYYPFDSDPFVGEVEDASGNGNDGVAYDVMLTDDRHGNQESAYYFGGYYSNNGGGAYVEIPDYDMLYNITTAVTITAWIKADDWGHLDGVGEGCWASVVCKGFLKRQYSLQIKCDSETRWNTTTRRNNIKSTSAMPTLGKWHHVAMTYDGATQTAYLDGAAIGFGTANDAIVAVAEPLYIGMDNPGGLEFFEGSIDEVRIYNRSLSSDEIMELYGDSGISVDNDTDAKVHRDENGNFVIKPSDGNTNVSVTIPCLVRL